MTDHLNAAGAAMVRLAREVLDPPSQASQWEKVRQAAVLALQELDIEVIDTSFDPEALDSIEPLIYAHASTPGEVEVWCQRYGFPYRYESGHIILEFPDKPGDMEREALRASGFGWKRSKGQWEHWCSGSWPNSKSGKAKAYREKIDEERRVAA